MDRLQNANLVAVPVNNTCRIGSYGWADNNNLQSDFIQDWNEETGRFSASSLLVAGKEGGVGVGGGLDDNHGSIRHQCPPHPAAKHTFCRPPSESPRNQRVVQLGYQLRRDTHFRYLALSSLER